MFEIHKYLLKYLCFSMLFFVGCSSFDQRINKESGVDNKRLEKRIEDLSTTITLIVNDTNRLHNKMEEVKTANKTIQQKIEGLEANVSKLNEQIASLNTPAKTPDIVQQPAEKTDVEPQLPITDSSKPSDKPASDVQKAENAEGQLVVARGFWNAMNTKDIKAVRSYATKESGDKLQIKDNDATTNRTVTFGEVNREDNKTTIETALQIYHGTATSEGMQKGLEELTQAGAAKPDITPPKQETTATSEIGEQTKRELFLKDNIARFAEAGFPGNKGIQWNILGYEHKAHLTYVEVEPTPATLGYPRFKFAVSFRNPEIPCVIGIFSFKDGQYSLLSTKKN